MKVRCVINDGYDVHVMVTAGCAAKQRRECMMSILQKAAE